jgi:hypothetical protein
MDIREALLEEHSKSQCAKIVNYIGRDKNRFAELMNQFFDGEYRVTQRAAWPMSNCAMEHPELIEPYFSKLLEMLKKPGVHDAVARNIIRLLQKVKIPKRYHGKIMTICFEYLASESAPVAVKAFSLTVLDNLSKDYPDIRPELKLIIEERWDHETAAFKSRARKILRRL